MKVKTLLEKVDLELDLEEQLLNTELDEIRQAFDEYTKTSEGYKLHYKENSTMYLMIYNSDTDDVKIALLYSPSEDAPVVGDAYNKYGDFVGNY